MQKLITVEKYLSSGIKKAWAYCSSYESHFPYNTDSLQTHPGNV